MTPNHPDYFVSDGMLQLNAAGQEFNQLHARVEREAAQLARSWTGAFFASILVAEPWLAAFDLRITASQEYDDQGGTFLSYSSAVSEVRTVEGMTLPDTVVDDDGAFDKDLAADTLTEQFDTYERDIFVSLAESDATELTVEVRREPIAVLLAAGSVSGSDAFQALFPQSASPASAEQPA
ncbi:hypothetical protein HI814_03270 [Ralstonia solanacearum]|nr:hypothetical protein HI814_03270 [Ralstonia solanacearum]QKM31816.1 hypothetical protein HI794_03270 [Ralstonia solanacearum]QKM36799.1 hypothetical protein HI793_03270 [Ralstonia solanacearum]